MTPGQSLTTHLVRVAAALYVVSVAAWLTRRDRAARAAWTAGCGFYLTHVYGAFEFFHHWSHTAAYRDTARQTAAVFGTNWGGGLYVNYVFTMLWIVDVLWWWRGLDVYRRRPSWISSTVQWFFAFMFFNATVVFAAGLTRWFGLIATAGLSILVIRASVRRS